MDTGSSLLWVKCLPCEPCSPASETRFFDPSKSSTFQPKVCVHIVRDLLLVKDTK
ncbi:hypothetical protein LINGRAPRIM_LOCUS780 [Linum grandiflorum]